MNKSKNAKITQLKMEKNMIKRRRRNNSNSTCSNYNSITYTSCNKYFNVIRR